MTLLLDTKYGGDTRTAVMRNPDEERRVPAALAGTQEGTRRYRPAAASATIPPPFGNRLIHRMKSYIYKSPRQDEMYLYLAQRDGFSAVPAPLLERFGRPQFVMELELAPGRTLARENPEEVRRNLAERGYHLQMPPVERLAGKVTSYH